MDELTAADVVPYLKYFEDVEGNPNEAQVQAAKEFVLDAIAYNIAVQNE